MSLRSKSPDDNSSLLSASSLDSALNHSREEEELRGLIMDQCYDDQCSNDEIEKVFSHSKFLFLIFFSFQLVGMCTIVKIRMFILGM